MKKYNKKNYPLEHYPDYELENYFYEKLKGMNGQDNLYILYTHFIKDIIKLLTINSADNFGSNNLPSYKEDIVKPIKPATIEETPDSTQPIYEQ
jgi:hypothetical protein